MRKRIAMRLHSWLSPKCVVAESPSGGLGVFATQTFAREELVCVWGGIVYSASEIEELSQQFPHFRTHPVSVADGFYLASTSNTVIDDAERFNHSCAPNIGVRGQIVLQARRDIQAGEELTFDYETTDLDPGGFCCECRSPQCRGIIDGTASRSTVFQSQNNGWLAWHIAEKFRPSKGV